MASEADPGDSPLVMPSPPHAITTRPVTMGPVTRRIGARAIHPRGPRARDFDGELRTLVEPPATVRLPLHGPCRACQACRASPHGCRTETTRMTSRVAPVDTPPARR